MTLFVNQKHKRILISKIKPKKPKKFTFTFKVQSKERVSFKKKINKKLLNHIIPFKKKCRHSQK